MEVSVSVLSTPIMSSPTLSMSIYGVSTPSFPTVTLGIPIATVCPLSLNASSGNIEQAFLPISFPTTTLSNITTSIISASATMPDGSVTTFSGLTRKKANDPGISEVVTVLPDGISALQIDGGSGFESALGTIIIGSDGCQTLYTPTITAICSTVVSPVGLPAVTVTDCDQYITFSSETLFSCAPTPTVHPLPAESTTSNLVFTRSPLDNSFSTRPLPSNLSSLTQDTNGMSASPTSAVPGIDFSTAPSESESLSAFESPFQSIAIPQTSPSTKILATGINPVTTKLPISLNTIKANDPVNPTANSISVPIPRRPRRQLTYTTAPTGVPMSVPDRLLAGSQPAKYTILMVEEDKVKNTVAATPSVGASGLASAPSTSIDEGRGTIDTIAGSGGGSDADVPVSATEKVNMFTFANIFGGRSVKDAVSAIFHKRQDSDDSEVDGAVNGTIGADVTTDMDTDTDTDLNAGTANVEGAGDLNVTVSSVSMPLSPMILATATDDTSLGVSSVTALETPASPLDTAISLPNTDAGVSLPTPAADTGVDTMLQPSTSIDMPTATDIDTVLSTTIPTSASTSTPIPTQNRLANLLPPQPTKYYLAPWYQFLPSSDALSNNTSPSPSTNGTVPINIKALTCRGGLEPVGHCLTPDTDGDAESCECEVEDQIWGVTSITRVRVGTKSVAFSGGVAVGDGMTSTVSFGTVVTTTETDVVGKIVKQVVTTTMNTDATGEGTVYATFTSYPSVTMTLVSNDATVSGQLSSTVDAAMGSAAGMPQGAPSSISTPTGTDPELSTTTSFMPSISYPTALATIEDLPSISTTLAVSVTGSIGTDTETNTDTVIEGTTMVTSIVATETVTVPGDESFGPMPTAD